MYFDKKPGKKFGGGGFNKRPSFGGHGGPAEMHDAECAECGSHCQVPFRPNGRKPVLCGNCFKKDGGSSFAPRQFNDRSDRPSYGDRPSFNDRPSYSERPARPAGNNDQLLEEVKKLNSKIDALLMIVTQLVEADDIIDDAETNV